MAFTSITSTAVQTGKAITTSLMNLIRTNFDDHETRLSSVESASFSTGFIVGEIRDYAGDTLPTGWLYCDGSQFNYVSEPVYEDLYNIIKYRFGGSGNVFNVPDLRGRVAAGVDAMDNSVGTGGGTAGRLTTQVSGFGGVGALGEVGGTQTHLLTAVQSGLPSHSTNSGDAAHRHFVFSSANTGAPYTTLSSSNNPNFKRSDGVNTDYDVAAANGLPDSTIGRTSQSSIAHSHTVTSAAAAQAHPNVQPTLVVFKIIRYLP